MSRTIHAKALKMIEFFAYILAGWSFAVLFLEPIFSYYTNVRIVENLTALANILLLVLTILSRLMQPSLEGQKKIMIFDVVILIMGSLLFIYRAKFVIFFLLIRQTYFILTFLIFRAFEGRLYRFLTSNPPVSLMISFMAVILVGTILLMLPAASNQGVVTSFVDALFTSTSATCVTGLIVVDTPKYFSIFGQIVILILIQVGGLGIMTISTAFALIMGQRLTLKLENVMHSVVGGSPTLNLFELLKNIMAVTLIIEAIGAVVLYFSFVKVLEPLRAFYFAVFHSVSAFCNAGFSLNSDNLMPFVDNVNINMGITFLIILGGIGFAVIIDMFHYFTGKEKGKQLSLHSKIVLVTTAGLIVGGFIAYFIAEYYASMKGFTLSRRILASWFQSVTTRTAGFNTIDNGRLSSASVLVSLILMFVGASPGSTGGGIKTTTFAVLMLSLISMLTGKRNLTVFNRKISLSNYREATSLITLAGGILIFILFFLLMTQPFSMDKIAFEAFSAFGTVGLSMGITAKLTALGKLLITLLMYIGRIGPLTIIYALSLYKRQGNVEFAEEKIAIG
ncbi:MAG TPA: TrkH family potassium uptake protein [Candidatus Cloacimonadota bacterium]|nr:TrkH family potassium uptake protein [Candidatus Cloacimonadota bacterium]HPS39001.1 TrkH family potassium uptake protein [Candidatus Cloacimonadota bacterium]